MNYVFIGWCRDEKENHDKVWGIIEIAADVGGDGPGRFWSRNRYLSFWGRRGKKLQTKVFEEVHWQAEEMARKKEKSGYKKIDRDALDKVYPEFQEDLEKTAMWATLSH